MLKWGFNRHLALDDYWNMREILIDCSDIRSTEAFWQRYLDAAKPVDAAMFGRNLDAFWDAVEGRGPGWPGEGSLVFTHSTQLSGLRTQSGSVSFLDALKAIAQQTSAGNVKFVE